MWPNKKQDDEKKILSWQDFSATLPPYPERDGSATSHIAARLRQILERFEESEFIKYLVAPSPVALSGFFHCAETDIYSALQELQRQGYEYEVSSKAGPITLWDPLIRRRTSSRRDEPTSWQVFYHALFNPCSPPAAREA